MYLFIYILTLYMFRAHRAHHQGRQIVSIQHLVAVTLCRWPCRVQDGSASHWSFTKNHYLCNDYTDTVTCLYVGTIIVLFTYDDDNNDNNNNNNNNNNNVALLKSLISFVRMQVLGFFPFHCVYILLAPKCMFTA